ncbi:class I SAM-dependent methyltransferase [Stakelama tenebrarum]|uniref:Class I SAM-dependent methyltransferase n=1 Tax=Stakelama tenebrarum TaxID=2711215 RepID=A0A6G6Y486_9SPHN|nr:class I SAM-dependent methyltransferase [Sphingosinithalassobacter tenebrarum]QIG79725.1 class I SAM-dependent methyltransferase [Sphingosinithalassobacter tenebrarum]
MSNLLIHSMSEFSDLILGSMHAAGTRSIVEVGAEFGGMSHQLAAYAEATGGSLTSIDPAPKAGFAEWAAGNVHVTHVADTSHRAMPGMTDVDAWVIDGDHNYYTVLGELRIADELSRRDGKPLLAFLHDVSWPCARRDMYYAPETLPPEWVHPHSWDGGVKLEDGGIHAGRGMRGMGQFAWAEKAGGPRNGVLTAVEDFLEEVRSDARPLAWVHVPAVLGLGVIFDASAPWAADVAALLHPWHDNQLVATLELNRLRNYLTVIEWQDREASRIGGRAAA